MTKTKAIALLVAVAGTLLYVKSLIPPPSNTWEQHKNAGLEAYQNNDYPEAEKQFSVALQEAEKFPPDDTRLHSSLNNLAEIYWVQEKYADAEPLIQRVLAIDKQALGPDHPNVAASLTNLAENYRRQGKFAQAELYFKRALAIWEQTLGPNDSMVIQMRKRYTDLLNRSNRKN